MYTWQPGRSISAASPRHTMRGLDRVATAASILDAIRVTRAAAAEEAADAAVGQSSGRTAVARLGAQARQADDNMVAIAAVHALARVAGPEADRALVEILEIGSASLPEHVAWTAVERRPSGPLLDAMVRALVGGRLTGMHAQAALAQWAARQPWLVAAALRAALEMEVGAFGRSHLVESLGLVPDRSVALDLASIARNLDEPDVVRAVAIAALGDRPGKLPPFVARLARGDDLAAEAARLAVDGARAAPFDARAGGHRAPARGLTVAQVHLGAELDPTLARSGMGDTGGVATLLVKLGSALAATPGIGTVMTIGRGSKPYQQEADQDASHPGHLFASVALAEDEGTAFSDPWPARIAARRGIRGIFARHGRPDVLHLRMADVGTLAAADVAVAMGIQVVFSLAPDPHAVIAARERAGAVDRKTFGAEDASAHLWYRADLVERLAARADEVVLFPRAHLADEIRSLVGIDVTAQKGRFTVVPEGIDVAHIQRSVSAHATAASSGPPTSSMTRALADLTERVASLPPSRHGLPIVLSVGRLNELKGMARLVEAFAIDPGLRSRANLVIVGGSIEDPTTVEAEELARIERTISAHPEISDAIVLLGHRPNGEVADLLGVVRHGAGPLIGSGGAYACASRKEEFGLAVVEALAAGLPVVAPLAGGPATYVEQGETGYLVDTADIAQLARGVANALDIADRPGRAERAADAIARRYDISEMARALGAVYGRAVASRVDRLAS